MNKIPVGTLVKVDGPANQYRFERIVDEGIVIDNNSMGCRNARYLVSLSEHRETLRFPRTSLSLIPNRFLPNITIKH
jgi:hypothetical protein